MGNTTSNGVSRRRHTIHPPPPQPASQPPAQPPQPEITGNQHVFDTSTSYPNQHPSPNLPQYHQYPGYHPLQPVSASLYYRVPRGQCPPGAAPPVVEHQKAVTIRNDVNIKKETVRVESDEENPGQLLVAFTFDANAAGSITVMFFVKEGVDCNLVATKGDLFKSVSISFEQGIGQKFRQPSGTGIHISLLENTGLINERDIGTGVYPLAVNAEAYPSNHSGSEANPTGNSQITLAVFDKREKGVYQVRVMKQILWVNGTRYELQEIYGIGNSVDGELEGNDPGKECVICLSEPRDTTILPCRHMCLCSECAKILRFQTNRCPICRQPIERLLEIKVNTGTDD